jgi:hypothetical protein
MLLPKLVRGLAALSLAHVAFAADKPLYPRHNESETDSGQGPQEAQAAGFGGHCWEHCYKTKTVTETKQHTSTKTHT